MVNNSVAGFCYRVLMANSQISTEKGSGGLGASSDCREIRDVHLAIRIFHKYLIRPFAVHHSVYNEVANVGIFAAEHLITLHLSLQEIPPNSHRCKCTESRTFDS